MAMEQTCNIGPREGRRRLRMGLPWIGVGMLLLVALILADAPQAWRLAAFPPLWGGALGYFQFREKT